MTHKISYRHTSVRAEHIVTALDAMLEHLNHLLKVTDKDAEETDTPEWIQKTELELVPDGKVYTEEELENEVNKNRDQTIAELGHLQRRIGEVKALRDAFAGIECPSDYVILKTFHALKSSITYEAMWLYTFVVEPSRDRTAEHTAEDLARKQRIRAYSQGLFFGFNCSAHMGWNYFPFDDHR